MPYSWIIACHDHVVYTRRAASAVWFVDYDKRCSSGALLNHLLCHVTTGPIVNILAGHFPHHWSLEQFDRAHFKWEQVQGTLRDPHAWLLILQMLFSQTAGNVTTNFLGIVIKGFGYTALKAQLYTTPNYAIQ
ncbi:hypothetical protein CBS147332_7523 [Penicillium roqueforti]|nr:hypothetical protein CBS147332_7523 [Penicillium roqueforti]KAI3102902.1 hypothetical protein CBS147331_7550 [Penicillium roqueforti]